MNAKLPLTLMQEPARRALAALDGAAQVAGLPIDAEAIRAALVGAAECRCFRRRHGTIGEDRFIELQHDAGDVARDRQRVLACAFGVDEHDDRDVVVRVPREHGPR